MTKKSVCFCVWNINNSLTASQDFKISELSLGTHIYFSVLNIFSVWLSALKCHKSNWGKKLIHWFEREKNAHFLISILRCWCCVGAGLHTQTHNGGQTVRPTINQVLTTSFRHPRSRPRPLFLLSQKLQNHDFFRSHTLDFSFISIHLEKRRNPLIVSNTVWPVLRPLANNRRNRRKRFKGKKETEKTKTKKAAATAMSELTLTLSYTHTHSVPLSQWYKQTKEVGYMRVCSQFNIHTLSHTHKFLCLGWSISLSFGEKEWRE